MTDYQFIQEVRARTGETNYIVGKTIGYIKRNICSTCYDLNYVYDNILDMVNWNTNSISAARSLITDK